MKRRIVIGTDTRRAALAMALCASLSGCASPAIFSATTYLGSMEIRSPDVSALADGQYRGSARVAVPLGSIVAYPDAEVEVTMGGGQYMTLKMLRPAALSEDPEFDKLADRIIVAQSPDVEGVSGASFTSLAFRLAVVEAVTR
jgi:uncharacterized protein with FMN-binding domain